MLNKLIKLVHINIGKNLRSQVADGHPFAVRRKKRQRLTLSQSAAHSVTLNNLFQKRNRLLIFNFLNKDIFQYLMVDGVKKFSDVAFQGVAWTCVISTRRAKHVDNFLHAFVGTFVDTARERIVDKCRLKYFIQHGKGGVVKHSVTNDRFVYPPEFRIMDPKAFIWPMPIRFILQVAVQVKNILLDMELKLSDIRLVPFIGLEYLPSPE
ncbi:MAG: hypothetical protein RLZZ67_343 [Candidatus Parcubacteria bacterium]